MAWAPAPTNPKYRTAEHRNRRAQLVKLLNAGQVLQCCEDHCLFDSRDITNPNGSQDDGLHLAHERDGVTYRGASHRACNLHDAGKRANLRSRGLSDQVQNSRWVL